MDGFTPIDEYLDRVDRDRTIDALAAATTNEEVAEIQADCSHKHKHVGNKWICTICDHEMTEVEWDGSIPFGG